jgi:EAL domain-containing protein (putative c-di-GMP-specific phosphodiesterase class I)
VALAIDDFGMGHSSLARLAEHPIEKLKIDRSVVSGMAERPDQRRMAEGIVGLARALGLTTVGEGVETSAERDLLREFGCDFAQGYLFARPAQSDDVHRWLCRQEEQT